VEDLHSHSCKKYCLYIVTTTYGLFLHLCLRNHKAPNLSKVKLIKDFAVVTLFEGIIYVWNVERLVSSKHIDFFLMLANLSDL